MIRQVLNKELVKLIKDILRVSAFSLVSGCCCTIEVLFSISCVKVIKILLVFYKFMKIEEK